MEQKFDYLGKPLFKGADVLWVHRYLDIHVSIDKTQVTGFTPKGVHIAATKGPVPADKLIIYKEENNIE